MITTESATRGCSRKRLKREGRAETALTQIDLLNLVVGLLVLGLWLTPVLAHTLAADQGFQCRTNMRQLMQGWQMFADDNGGKVAPAFDWVGGWLSYTINTTDNTNVDYLVHGLLGPYVRNPAAYKCPSDQSQATFSTGTSLRRVRSVSMSQAFVPYGDGHLEDTFRHYVKLTGMDLPRPADLWVLLDESPDSINDGAYASVMTPYGGIWQDGPSILHEGGCGFAFADGHAEIKRWTDTRTLRMCPTYSKSFPFGWSQPNNRDIMWLQDRTSAKK
jgi:prepilin-type processing-associated H-X9-DG protein